MGIAILLVSLGPGLAQERGQTSYAPVDIKETFGSIMTRMNQDKPQIRKRQADLLSERYDLSNRPAQASRCRAESRFRKASASSCLQE